MSAYLVVRVNIIDQEQYKKYINIVPSIIKKFGGKYAARAGKTVTLEGPDETRRIIIIEFPSLAKAEAFYNSEEYREARKLRKDAAIGEIIAVEGIPA